MGVPLLEPRKRLLPVVAGRRGRDENHRARRLSRFRFSHMTILLSFFPWVKPPGFALPYLVHRLPNDRPALVKR